MEQNKPRLVTPPETPAGTFFRESIKTGLERLRMPISEDQVSAVAQARAAKAVNVIDCSSLIRALRTKITGKPIFAVACFQFLGVSSAPSFLNRGINLFLRVVIIAEQKKVTEIAVNTE
jgi:hypothetical protein